MLRAVALFVLLASAGLAGPPPRVLAVDIDGVVHPITAEIVARAVQQAASEHDAAILIRLNTPGGLLDATRRVIQSLVASSVPVITYVTPSGGRAASAGFFILEAGDIAAMAPGTNTGASSPVLIGQQMDPVMRSKVENDTAALLRGLTSHHGRNTELAEKTIREAKAFTDKEALDNHLIDTIAPNEAELFRIWNGREVIAFSGAKQKMTLAGAQVIEFPLTTRERLVSAIADPNIGFILLVLGALGIYAEFSSPGLIFPGVFGAVLVLLGLSSLSVLPINWVGVALLVLAITLFALEAKFTSHGVLGIGGAISMILGALLLINGPPEVRIHFATAVAVTVPFAIITLFLVGIVVRARRAKVLTGPSGLLDEVGIARTDLAPEGRIFVHGEYWNAVSSSPIPAGARVRVTGVDGLTVRVEPVG
ncbi:MAG TPA: nodulation protein NfeD [Bryobacteraceae bacterium]|nr:nodulation protein NfeD [Bryobacteraceae bacterium]